MARTITYHGDIAAPYDPDTGAGLVGKVMGVGGRWYIVGSATYDPADNTTLAVLEPLKRPEQRLDEMSQA